MTTLRLLLSMVVMLLAACGARSQGGALDDVASSCPLPRAIPDAVQTVSSTRCRIEGRGDDGRQYAIVCDSFDCMLLVDGVLRCQCPQRDWANTCANGIALCVGWNRPLDFSRMQYRSE